MLPVISIWCMHIRLPQPTTAFGTWTLSINRCAPQTHYHEHRQSNHILTFCRAARHPSAHSSAPPITLAAMSAEDTQTEQPATTSADPTTTSTESTTSPDTATDSSDSAPTAAEPHPLHRSWTFWFSKPSTSATWGSALKQVTALYTAEQLWSLLNAIKQPSQLQVKHDYYLFHSGIAPEWEDSQNKNGGKW